MNNEFERLKENNFAGYLRKPIRKASLFEELKLHLPFDESIITDSTDVELVDQEQHENLPQVIESLKPLHSQFETCNKHKDIAEIRLFSESLIQLTEQYPNSAISDFAQNLNDSIERFDISAIKKAMHDYPKLIKRLESYL